MSTFKDLKEQPIKLFFGGDWSIHTGESEFLVVEGPEWTSDFGQEIFLTLSAGRHVMKFKNKWVCK